MDEFTKLLMISSLSEQWKKRFFLSLDCFVNETVSTNEDRALYITLDEISELRMTLHYIFQSYVHIIADVVNDRVESLQFGLHS
jgi:hypothetical protein